MGKIALQIRLDETTHAKLKIIGENELRSLNAQIEYFLLQSIKDYETTHDPIDFQKSE